MSCLKYFLLLVVFSFTDHVSAQRIFIGTEETNRKLTWDDFRGPVDPGSSHHAMTTWFIGYTMEDVTSHGNAVKIGKIDVTLRMEPGRSWSVRDKITDELLKHEQGHFDIGVLCLREFISLFNQTTFTRHDLDRKMKKIFNEVMTKYHELGMQYDQETDHSNNKEAQQKWNEFFEKYI